jgi:hypothetical protein
VTFEVQDVRRSRRAPSILGSKPQHSAPFIRTITDRPPPHVSGKDRGLGRFAEVAGPQLVRLKDRYVILFSCRGWSRKPWAFVFSGAPLASGTTPRR